MKHLALILFSPMILVLWIFLMGILWRISEGLKEPEDGSPGLMATACLLATIATVVYLW